MKISITLISLLSTISVAMSTPRSDTAAKLPIVEGDFSDHTKDAGEAQPASRSGLSAQSAQLCQRGYPFYCDGFCCQLNRCCARECCGSRATFCGADGLCYI